MKTSEKLQYFAEMFEKYAIEAQEKRRSTKNPYEKDYLLGVSYAYSDCAAILLREMS